MLVTNVGRPLVLLDEVTQLGLGRLQLGCERLTDLGALAHQLDVVLEPLAFLVVQRPILLALLVVADLRVAVRGERSAVGPRAPGLDGDDLRGGRGEQLAVVADEQHGLAGGVQLLLEPALGGDVEEVVGFVEHEDVELAPQQRFEREPLLFAATERAQRSVGHVVERLVERPGDAFVPRHLQVVAPGVAPPCERIGVAPSGRRRGAPRHRRPGRRSHASAPGAIDTSSSRTVRAG